MKQSALIIFIFFCSVLKSQTANIDFEATPVGTYTSANAVSGWTVSSQVNTSSVCNTSTVWTPGSPEFSIVSTPIAAFPVIGNILQSPLGGNKVARLNNSTANGSVTKLSRTYSVTSSHSLLKYAFAGVWEDGNHYFCDQTSFILQAQDQSGNTIACLTTSLAPGSGNSTSNMSFSTTLSTAWITWNNWQVKFLDLSQFVNTVITIEILSNDCSYGDHFGTLFFDADFPYVPPPVNYCGGLNPLKITAPGPDYNFNLFPNNYLWYATSGPYTVGIPQAYSYTLQTTSYPNGNIYTLINYFGGCSSAYIYSISPTSVNIGTILSTPSCINGGSGTATVIGIGSGGGYIYSWINSTNSVVSTNSILANVPSGNYSLNIMAAGSASSTCGTSSAVVIIGSGTIAPTTLLQPFCGIQAFLTAPQGSNYQWYHQTSTITGTAGGTAQSFTVNPAQSTDTYMIGYDAPTGCRDSIDFILVAATPGSLSISSGSLYCYGATGSSASLSITNPASPGPNSYYISSIGNTPSYTAAPGLSQNFTASNLTAGGTYSVTAFDGFCPYSSVYTLPSRQFSYNITPSSPTLCSGNSQAFSVTALQSNFSSSYTYSWSPSTFLFNNGFSTTLITPTTNMGSISALVYTVDVTSSTGSCVVTKTVAITVANLATPIVNTVPLLCENSPAFTVVANPSWGFYSNNNAITYDGVITPSLALPGVHTFSYITAIGPCSTQTAANFTIAALPSLSVASSSTLCMGKTITLIANGANTYLWNNISSGAVFTNTPNSNVVYTVSGTSSITNCSNEITFPVTIISNPTLSIAGQTLICAGDETKLTAIGANTFTWSTLSNSLNILISPTITTTYTLEGTSTAGCYDSEILIVTVDQCNGFIENIRPNPVSVYPNPSSNKLLIETQKEIKISIYDAAGKLILDERSINENYNLDVSNYAKGLYFLRVSDSKISQTIKFIKTD